MGKIYEKFLVDKTIGFYFGRNLLFLNTRQTSSGNHIYKLRRRNHLDIDDGNLLLILIKDYLKGRRTLRVVVVNGHTFREEPILLARVSQGNVFWAFLWSVFFYI